MEAADQVGAIAGEEDRVRDEGCALLARAEAQVDVRKQHPLVLLQATVSIENLFFVFCLGGHVRQRCVGEGSDER